MGRLRCHMSQLKLPRFITGTRLVSSDTMQQQHSPSEDADCSLEELFGDEFVCATVGLCAWTRLCACTVMCLHGYVLARSCARGYVVGHGYVLEYGYVLGDF